MDKSLSTMVVALLAAICAILLFQTVSQRISPPVKWEYKVEAIPDDSFVLTMDSLGAAGWEAVSARRASSGTSENTVFSYEVIFKRPVGVYERKLIGEP